MEVTSLRNYLEKRGIWEEFYKLSKKSVVKPKTILLREGEISKKLFVVEKGCLRAFFYKDERDITTQFFFENDSVASMESFLRGIPSQVSIESIEKSEIFVFDKSRLYDFLKKYPDVGEVMHSGLLNRLFYYANYLMSFLKDTPLERYKNLLKENPKLIQRVPHHYIASYLGITPVSLSRLRNRITRKK